MARNFSSYPLAMGQLSKSRKTTPLIFLAVMLAVMLAPLIYPKWEVLCPSKDIVRSALANSNDGKEVLLRFYGMTYSICTGHGSLGSNFIWARPQLPKVILDDPRLKDLPFEVGIAWDLHGPPLCLATLVFLTALLRSSWQRKG